MGTIKPNKILTKILSLGPGDIVMGGTIDINVDVFWETSVGFLKSVVLQFFPKYSQRYVDLNVKSRVKFNCL